MFSKGGFVSVPVVLAAKHCHIPAIIHESDITPGLANRIAIRGAKKVCCNFPETMKYLPADKAILTGSPIRRELFSGDAESSISVGVATVLLAFLASHSQCEPNSNGQNNQYDN